MLTFRSPAGAMTAEEFECQGYRPASTSLKRLVDITSAEWTQHILDKYATKVIAYNIAPV
jgi:hypothetical protein